MIGHNCTGGGAKIENSPIVINIHIHAAKEPIINKIMRGIYESIGKRHIAIENTAQLSSSELQGHLIRACKNR